MGEGGREDKKNEEWETSHGWIAAKSMKKALLSDVFAVQYMSIFFAC